MTPPAPRPDAAAVIPRLRDLFARLDARIDDYLDYLQQLHDALRDNDAPRLEQLLPHDQALQQALDTLLQQRQGLLAELGEDSLGDLLGHLGEPEDLMQARRGVEQKLEDLRRQLMSNDILLRHSRQRLRQSIGILAGHFDKPQPSAYSRDGALQGSGGQRSLARA